MRITVKPIYLLPLLIAAGCASVPNGPAVTAYPGSGKSFDQFRADDNDCRSYAAQQNNSPSDAQADSVVKSAALGTVVGAIAGAAIGGSRGAGVGAGAGLLFGTAAGASEGNRAAYGTQRRYDTSYSQCMYAKGNKVPINGRLMSGQASPGAAQYPPPPPDYVPPPPSAGQYPQYPPPPPSR
jgi:outer membrane lipoprotein SlyB